MLCSGAGQGWLPRGGMQVEWAALGLFQVAKATLPRRGEGSVSGTGLGRPMEMGYLQGGVPLHCPSPQPPTHLATRSVLSFPSCLRV